mgnify:CR=1 FL=1
MYEVYERQLCVGYAATAAKAEPYCRCEDLEAAKAEADCIAEFGLNAFVWDGAACVYDPDEMAADGITVK